MQSRSRSAEENVKARGIVSMTMVAPKGKIERGEIQPLFMQIIRRHCIPLHAVAADYHGTGNAKFTGGSALLWETICGRFFVTAFHVWQELARLTQGPLAKSRLLTYDLNGPILIHLPRLIDASEELDIAVFDVPGIKDFSPAGKAFLQNLSWPTPPAQSDEMIVGCGYPGELRKQRGEQYEQGILVWAHRQCSVSKTGSRLLLDGNSGKGKASYFTKETPKALGLPGISGAPLFALRDTLDWVGIVRSGSGTPPNGYSIQATPSGFVDPDGHIRCPTP
jgi:hypothetical protein